MYEVYTHPLTSDIPAGQQRELQTVVVTAGHRKSRVTRTVMYDRDHPENNPFGIAGALVYRYAQTAPGRLGVFMTPPGRDRRELRGDILRGSIFGRGQSGIDAQ
jgi:hypothetical protein